MSDDDIEIIPRSRSNLPARRSANTDIAVGRASSAPVRVRPPTGIISSALTRMEARRSARTYDALTARTNAERSLVEADTALGNSLIKNARMRHEYDELPETLAADRAKRQIRRIDEVRDAYHQLEMADNRRAIERTQAEAAVTDARVGLTAARERLSTARRGLLNADQELEAQRQRGPRYHDLEWQRRIGEREVYVEEQQTILAEHRRRGAQGGDMDELLQQRDQLNADGRDTRAVDLAIERGKARSKR